MDTVDWIYRETCDNLRWLENKVEQERNNGILGEADPEITVEFKDVEAEEIGNLLVEIANLLDELKNGKASTSYFWYSPRTIFTTLFGRESHSSMVVRATRTLETLVLQATHLTITTSDFRNRYEHIYRAAICSVLPQRIANHQICIQNNGLKHAGIGSIIGVGLRVEQSPCALFSFMSMDLDTAHRLDRTLVSLSVDMANLLEITWRERSTTPEETVHLVQQAGEVFQVILVISQGNTLVRMSVSGLLNDVSEIISTLKRVVNFKSLSQTSLFSIQNRTIAEKALRLQKEVIETQETQQQLQKVIRKLSSQVTALAKHATNANTNTGQSEQLDHAYEESDICLSSRELTFDSTTQWMDENCSFEKLYDSPEKQEFKSGVDLRSGSYADVYRVRLREIREVAIKYCPEPDTTIRMHWEVDETLSAAAFQSEQSLCELFGNSSSGVKCGIQILYHLSDSGSVSVPIPSYPHSYHSGSSMAVCSVTWRRNQI